MADDLMRRISYLKDIGFQEAPPRYVAFLNWLESQPPTRDVLSRLREVTNLDAICEGCGPHRPPIAATPEDIARVGLYFFEYCRENSKNLPGLFIGFGLDSKWGGNHIDGYFASAIDKYIQPFIGYLVHEVRKKDEQLSAEDVATFRMNMIFSDDFASRFPGVSSHLVKLSKEFFALDHSENWFNASNSCRELLKCFTTELYSVLSESKPDDLTGGDVKGLLKHFVTKRHAAGRTRDTLCNLISAVWEHTQCLLHRTDTTKEEAMRIYMWTALLISEIYELTE